MRRSLGCGFLSALLISTAVITQSFLGQEVSRSFVPEPSTFSMLLVAMSGLAAWARVSSS